MFRKRPPVSFCFDYWEGTSDRPGYHHRGVEVRDCANYVRLNKWIQRHRRKRNSNRDRQSISTRFVLVACTRERTFLSFRVSYSSVPAVYLYVGGKSIGSERRRKTGNRGEEDVAHSIIISTDKKCCSFAHQAGEGVDVVILVRN